MGSLESASYPPNAPITARPDFRGENGYAATDVAQVASQVFDRWGASTAILNCLYGVQLIFNEDMARAFASALNDWIAKEWLDRDPRLRASIVVPMQNVEYAVDEIERCAKDRRFVQILVLAMQETPLGRRHHWPIFAAAERHGLPIGIHAGSNYRNPVTSLGWPSSLRRGLHQPVTGLSGTGREPDHRRRVRQVSQAEGGADRVGRDLAAGVPVALLEILARRAHRDSVGRPLAVAKSCATISASPSSRSTARPTRTTWNASSSTCVRTICCCFHPTFRIGSSTATNACRTAFRKGCGARYWWRIRSRRMIGSTVLRAQGRSAMNIEVRQPVGAQKTRYGIVDCDIHPKLQIEEMPPHLSNQWWAYLQTYGLRPRHGFTKSYPMPKITPQAARRDAWPPSGGLPGSDLGFMREQLLDLYDMDYGILNPLQPTAQGDQNAEFSAAMAFAANEKQLERWTAHEQAAQGLGRRAVRESGSLGGRDQAPRRLEGLRAGVHAQPHVGSAWAAPLLADLSGGGRGGPAGRHPRVRLCGLADDQFGLAVVLHRGDDRARDRPAGRGREHDLRRPVRAVPRSQGRADRSPASAGSRRSAGGSTSTGSACATRSRM